MPDMMRESIAFSKIREVEEREGRSRQFVKGLKRSSRQDRWRHV